MDLVVDIAPLRAVEVGTTGLRQIAQEIRTLLLTPRGSVPLDRDFGVSWEMIDSPIPAARQMYVAEVAAQIHKYIPRVRFTGIDFPETSKDESQEGLVRVRVKVEIREEYLDELE